MLKNSKFTKPIWAEDFEPVDLKRPNPLATELGRLVDDFVKILKNSIINSPTEKRGVWDRIKNWWSNLIHGQTSTSNPYYWQNKLGGMGRTVECTDLMPLEHYKVIREQAVLLEEMIPAVAEKLQIVHIIDSWAKNFKKAIINLAYYMSRP